MLERRRDWVGVRENKLSLDRQLATGRSELAGVAMKKIYLFRKIN